MRRAAHAALLVASVPFLLLAFLAIGLFAALAIAADHVLPDARFGNCFTFAVARWARYGGYVPLRAADDVTLLGLKIPHALWQSHLGGPTRMTYPLKRRRGAFPWWAILFRFEIWHSDSPKPRADWQESTTPPAWDETQIPPPD